MTQTLRRLLKGTLAAIAAMIIALAVISTAARLLLPHAEGLRESLIARLSESLGVQVEVGALTIHLHGLRPELRFSEAKLLTPGSSPAEQATRPGRLLLAAEALSIELDVLASLAARGPRIDAIGLVGAEIQVQRDTDGRIRILGLDAMQGNDPHALAFFLSEGRFRLIDSRLRWRDHRNRSLSQTLLIEVAELVNRGEHHDLRLRARSSPAADTPLRIDALRVLGKLEGPARHPERWSGQLYLKVEGEELASGVIKPFGSELELRASDIRVETWNQLEQGRLTESLTAAGAEGLVLDLGRSQDGLRLGDLSTRAHWQRQAEGWRLDLDDLRLPGATATAPTSAVLSFARTEGLETAAPGGEAETTAAASGARLFAAVGALPIGPVAELIGALVPDSPELLAELGQGRVQGLARRLGLHLGLQLEPAADPGPAQAPRISDWRLQGAIEDLAIAAGAGVPPVSGLNLDVDLGPTGGWAQLEGRRASLDLRPLFARVHRLTALDGRFAWRLMPAGSIHLWTHALRAETANIESLTRLSLCVHPSGANPFIDLHTRLRNGRIEALPNWLPVGIMDERLQDWLLGAIVEGELESGDLLLRGPLEAFPFDDQQGRFLLELRAVDGVLDYGFADTPAPSATGMRADDETEPLQWPPLQQVAATVRFEGRRLEIEVPSAEILNTQVDAGQVSMPDLWNPAYLTIAAHGNGPLADGMHLLRTSPLARQLGGLAASAEVSGSGEIALQLGVPLNRALPFRYSGELTWEPPLAEALPDARANASADGNHAQAADERTLSIKGTELHFSNIEGRLQFDEVGISAEAIQADLGRQALSVDVSTLASGSNEARTEIALRGRTPVDRLAEALPTDLWQLARGWLDWRLVLGLRNRDATEQPPPITFELDSDLQGLALSLPAPIGKAAGERRAFRLGGRFQDRWPLELRLAYAELGALIEVGRGPGDQIELQRLAVDLNGEPTALPPPRSIEISGALATLDLAPWLDWIAGNRLRPLPANGNEEALQLLPIRLEVNDLHLDALRLTGLEAALAPEAQGRWGIEFDAEQSGRGQVRVPASGSGDPLWIRLQRLDLAPLVAASGETSAPTTGRARNDPRAFGRLDLEVEQLHYGDDLLGRLRMRTEPQPNGVRFAPLSLNGPHVEATGQAAWTIDATDYIETSIELDAKSNAIGELLRESGFYSALSGAPGELQLELQWPGGPGQLSLARARGALEMDVGAGRMLDMEPGVGRMLGILNTAALSRRLSLDFSDVFDDGFSFDRIHGDIAIGNGQARIRDLSIQAPPADIRITGRTDLVAGVLDQSVEVTPEIGVGLALAGTVAGGPVVGAAVFLADKVTDGGFERLGRYAYKVTGPWRDPVIRRVDTGGSPSVGNLFVDDRPNEERPAATATSPGATEAEKQSSPFLEDF